MGLKDKLPNMTDEEKLRLLASDGMLVKRPILVGDDFVLIGFKEKEWAENWNNFSKNQKSALQIPIVCYYVWALSIGVSPSGKAPDSDSGIP